MLLIGLLGQLQSRRLDARKGQSFPRELLAPLCRRSLLECLLDQLYELDPILDSFGVSAKALIGRPFRSPQYRAEDAELSVVAR